MIMELHVIFNGDVQGVGFRATAKRMADEFQLTGYVKNLPNGSVELVAQGSKDTLEQFLSALRKRFKIHEVAEKYVRPSAAYSSFEIY
jgi:acylphosphatase